MKIALVNHTLGSGGAEKLICDMATEMKERGISADVILLTRKKGIYDDSLSEKGVRVIHLSEKWDIYSPKNILKLIKVLKNYDVVHTHIYSAQLWTAAASYFLPGKIKYITTEHNTTNNRRGKWYFRILDRWMYSRYQEIVSITSEVREYLFRWLGEEPAGNPVIKNGIVLENFIHAEPLERESLGLNPEDRVIIMVARFNEQKDQKTLIEAMKYLSEEYKLLLVGQGGLEADCRNRARELGVENRVSFLGYRKDIPQLLKTSDICVLSSHYEGLPISALEAMASGRPFVGSCVPGIKELVENNGVLFERGDSEELSKIIKKLCEEKEFNREISEKCLAKAKEYDIKATVDEYLELYRR